jgi:hypothetical protein
METENAIEWIDELPNKATGAARVNSRRTLFLKALSERPGQWAKWGKNSIGFTNDELIVRGLEQTRRGGVYYVRSVQGMGTVVTSRTTADATGGDAA